jgi:hypothetical protein
VVVVAALLPEPLVLAVLEGVEPVGAILEA